MSGKPAGASGGRAADCRQCTQLRWEAGKAIYRCGIGGGQVEVVDMGATFGGIVGEDALSAQATPVLCAFDGPHRISVDEAVRDTTGKGDADKQMGAANQKKSVPWDATMPGDDRPLWETCAASRANGDTWDSILDVVERKTGQRVAVATIIQVLKSRMTRGEATTEQQDAPAVAHHETRSDGEGRSGTETPPECEMPATGQHGAIAAVRYPEDLIHAYLRATGHDPRDLAMFALGYYAGREAA